MKQKIGIMGSGPVAQAIAAGCAAQGHEVMMGSRTPGSLEAFGKEHNLRCGSFEDAARFGSVLVLAVKGEFAAEVLEMAGPQHLDAKTVIDTTNPIAAAPPEDGVLRFFTSLEESLMERLQERFPAAHFVKAFNCVGSALMYKPSLSGGTPTMFICGNNIESKKTAAALLDSFGWQVKDMGKATSARAIEPLCMLWCIPGFLNNEWAHAFSLLS